MYRERKLYIFLSIYIYAAISNGKGKNGKKGKTKVQAIFLNPFSICSLCKRKFVLSPFFNEETNGSYPFANGLNGLDGLDHLCLTLPNSVDVQPGGPV
jgi:hypothetical protein